MSQISGPNEPSAVRVGPRKRRRSGDDPGAGLSTQDGSIPTNQGKAMRTSIKQSARVAASSQNLAPQCPRTELLSRLSAPAYQTTTLPSNQKPSGRSIAIAPSGATSIGPAPHVEVKCARGQAESTPQEIKNRTQISKWKHLIAERIKDFDSQRLINEAVERPRYRVLMEACEDEDYFYITLHQILCALSLDKAPIHDVLRPLVDPSTVDTAFDMLQTVFGENASMSSTHLQWFANFPAPLERLTKFLPSTTIAGDIAACLEHLKSHLYSLLQDIKARRYPLLTWELIETLHCPASRLQAMLFIVSCRWLGIQDSPLPVAMGQVYVKDRANEVRFAAHGESSEMIRQARLQVSTRYQEVILQVQQQQRQAAPSMLSTQPFLFQASSD
ncbi:hypothetical protein FDECE_7102 [Fusarium decemcellulare]|nr:hypothetical protein FDECE_7102 [Fusarium decemcellulare]